MVITAMVILERCRAAERELRQMREKVARYRDATQRMTSTLDGVGARGTGESDRLAAVMGEIDELESRAALRNREYTAEVAAACRLLDRLPELECSIMNRYYIRGRSLREIGVELGYSYNYVRNRKVNGCHRLSKLGEGEILRLLPTWYVIEEEKRTNFREKR